MANRRVLVTGGAGFIGSHVAEAYLGRGDRVWIIDDLSTGHAANIPSGATFIHANISDERVQQLFAETGGFDIVSHHAAQPNVRRSVDDPRFDARINLDGFLNIAEAARQYGAGRFILISSGGVIYGEPEVLPTPEHALKMPLSPYGVSKLACEHYLHYYHTVHGMDYVALRYGNVYGPRQDPDGEAGVIAIFATRLRDGQALTIYGDGEQTRDYVFVEDVVSANLLMSDVPLDEAHELDQRAFNVGTGVGTSVNELARVLAEISGKGPNVEHAAARPGELMHSRLDTTAMKRNGWQPARSLRDGLRATYEYIRNRE